MSSGATASTDFRARAIAAARDLAEEGGYDAVQMRDVVKRTGMSSATIYRHFSSKDQLLAEVRLEWIGELQARTASRASRASAAATAADRVAAILHASVRAFARSPRLGRAVIIASGSADPGVKATLATSGERTNEILREAVAGEPIDVEEYVLLVGIAWHGALVSWAQGRMGLDQVDRLVQRAARLLLAGARGDNIGGDG
jgi:AcrR family transcriptional regulator